MKLGTRSARSPIGLDLGVHCSKAVQLDIGAAQPSVAAALSLSRSNPGQPFSSDDAQRLVSVLDRRGFSGRQVVLVVPSHALLSGVLTLPPRASGAPLEQIAATELAHTHRRDPSEIEVAFWELPTPARAADGTYVMAAGCAHEDADRYLGILESVGLDVIALDIQGWAIARACRGKLGEQSMVAAVDIGWDNATLVLLHHATVVYERNLAGVGIGSLASAIAREQAIKPPVVDYLLYERGLDTSPSQGDFDRKLAIKARSSAESHFNQLVQELQLAIGYAQHQYPQTPIQSILLMGGGAAVAGLGCFVGDILETPVEIVDPASLFDTPAALKPYANHPSLTVAAGLAMYHAIQEAAA